MKPLPTGESNYESLITNGYYYVDKTMYIEKLEKVSNRKQMLLRPRKFGKSLFVSTLMNYYDILKKGKFEELYGNTYIGKNPTSLRNSYCILNFDFSGIQTNSEESTIQGFKEKVLLGIRSFINRYNIDFFINEEKTAEIILANLFVSFESQRPNEKIYVIIDEYDQFANELLGLNTDNFKKLVTENGKVRKWYEVLKQGCFGVVDRVFITGVAPITLDSLTSGFNIATDLTRDREFNEIFGFTEEELKSMMSEIEIDENTQKEILPIMKEYYDGYKFSLYGKENLYNSNMSLYFLDLYTRFGRIPERMLDTNIASDYKKLGGMLDLCRESGREEIITNSISGDPIVSQMTDKFNLEERDFTTTDLVSELFYLGYLTIAGEELGKAQLKVPNRVMLELYSEYFLNVLSERTGLEALEQENVYTEMAKEVAYEGRIDKMVEVESDCLNRLSNRDYMNFDEKYIKLIFFNIALNLKTAIFVDSEKELQRRYIDIFMRPKDISRDYYSVLIEFKYLKKDEENKLREKQEEARKQVQEYKELEEIKQIKKLRSYTVVAVNDKLYVEEV